MSDGVTYEQQLERYGKILRTNVGVSMLPLLREGRDVMIIERPNGRLKKYDMPLYRRGDDYVLHRIIKVNPDGYDIIGDNCVSIERDVKEEQVIGVLTGIIRDGKEYLLDSFTYKLYYHIWCDFLYIRILLLKIKFLCKGALRRIRRLLSRKEK